MWVARIVHPEAVVWTARSLLWVGWLGLLLCLLLGGRRFLEEYGILAAVTGGVMIFIIVSIVLEVSEDESGLCGYYHH